MGRGWPEREGACAAAACAGASESDGMCFSCEGLADGETSVILVGDLPQSTEAKSERRRNVQKAPLDKRRASLFTSLCSCSRQREASPWEGRASDTLSRGCNITAAVAELGIELRVFHSLRLRLHRSLESLSQQANQYADRPKQRRRLTASICSKSEVSTRTMGFPSALRINSMSWNDLRSCTKLIETP